MADAMTKRVEKLEQSVQFGYSPRLIVLENSGEVIPPGTNARDIIVFTGVPPNDVNILLSDYTSDMTRKGL